MGAALAVVYVTPHFAVHEFDCHNGTPYPPEWIEERLAVLCEVLEVVRAELGSVPATILSGYRPAAYNEALRNSDGSGTGVAKQSQHIEGRAGDVTFKGVTPLVVYQTAMRLWKAGKLPQLGGLGFYRTWVHFDVRPTSGHLAQWADKGLSVPAYA